MKKLVILSLIAPAVLGVAACTPPAANNTTVDLNTTVEGNDMMAGNDAMMAGGNDSMSNEMAPPNAM